MVKFINNDDIVTAEQHALDNVGHHVVVFVETEPNNPELYLLKLVCVTCGWFDEQ